MAQLDSRTSIIKGKQICTAESSSGGQWQCDASGISVQTKPTFDPSFNIWQVGAKVCIFRVPNPIMICKWEAYVPSTVSLGPYHHNSNHKLSTMNQHKQEAVRRMMTRINKDEAFLIKEVQKLEREIRECYEEKINCDGETLCCMMIYDACFILEFFRCGGRTRSQNRQGYFSLVFQNKGHRNCMHYAVLCDIMKLENQVPLIVLITILQLEFDYAIPELAALLSDCELFKGFPFYPSLSDDDINSKQKDDAVKSKLQKHIGKDPRHLLDLYRMVIIDLLTPQCSESYAAGKPGYVQLRCPPDDSSFASDAESLNDKRYTPSAKKLQSSGIEFEPGQVGFEKRQLGISKVSFPQITVKNRTETLLRNLMAYEECQRCSWKPEETVISHYVRLLDNLIDSEKDVSVLRDSKVIQSFVGSDEVIVHMFNDLGIGITFDPLDSDTAQTINRAGIIHQYERVMIEATEHYNSKWMVWIGQFREEYCSNPWVVISLLAGTALLVMTVIQTWFTVN